MDGRFLLSEVIHLHGMFYVGYCMAVNGLTQRRDR